MRCFVLACALVALATASVIPEPAQKKVQVYHREDSYQTKNGYNPAYGKQEAGYKKVEYSAPDNKGYHDNSYGVAPRNSYHGLDGYGVAYEKKSYGYEHNNPGYGYDNKPAYGYDNRHGYGYDNRHGYGYDNSHGYGYDGSYGNEKHYYERREYSHDRDGYGYGPHGNRFHGYGHPYYPGNVFAFGHPAGYVPNYVPHH